MIPISTGSIKEQAILLLKLLNADSKREERLLNLVHSTEEGGREEDNELVRNQLLWSQEKTDQQLQKREHETNMFLLQASGKARETKGQLETTETEVKKYISEIRFIDVRLVRWHPDRSQRSIDPAAVMVDRGHRLPRFGIL